MKVSAEAHHLMPVLKITKLQCFKLYWDKLLLWNREKVMFFLNQKAKHAFPGNSIGVQNKTSCGLTAHGMIIVSLTFAPVNL